MIRQAIDAVAEMQTPVTEIHLPVTGMMIGNTAPHLSDLPLALSLSLSRSLSLSLALLSEENILGCYPMRLRRFLNRWRDPEWYLGFE